MGGKGGIFKTEQDVPRFLTPQYRGEESAIGPDVYLQNTNAADKRRCQSLSPSIYQSKDDSLESKSGSSARDTPWLQTNEVQGDGAVKQLIWGVATMRDEYILSVTYDYRLEQESRRSLQRLHKTAECASAPGPTNLENDNKKQFENGQDITLPQCIVTKLMRTWAIKKREFIKLRRILITQQNTVLEHYATLKELESRAGVTGVESLGEVRVLSVASWPAHDLLLLVRDDLQVSLNSEISSLFGPQVLQQLITQLTQIPEEVQSMVAEVVSHRIELLKFLNDKRRCERATYHTNLEWKTKSTEFDRETERLHKMVAGSIEKLKTKINNSLALAKIPWLDREELVKKIERLQRENSALEHKVEEISKKDVDDIKSQLSVIPPYQAMCEDLAKERAARESLKEVVTSAENMLRVARGRIATLERLLKETRFELETARTKNKELEQLVNKLALEHSKTYRQRETTYDARSKKLLEVSKTGEITIESLSRQRDALELRVKELHEQAALAEHAAEVRQLEQRSHVESLLAKVAEQDKNKVIADNHITELENCVKELEERLQALRERSDRLLDMERRRLEYAPSKENEPSGREVEIWKELQVTKASLFRTEEELQQCRADKDNFLNSLSRIAQGGDNSLQDQMSKELLEREQKIARLQHIIDELKTNKKNMEQNMTHYENQLAALRFEIKRLRHYDCYSKEITYSELETELIELHMQVDKLDRERTALFTAATSKALMLERYEKSADLFSRMIRMRREIAALLDGRTESFLNDETIQAKMSQSLSSVCASAADTWSALQVERARVLQLESAVVAQSLQLEREGCVRTQLERRRTLLERELLRERHHFPSDQFSQNPNLILDNFWSKSS